MTPEEKLKQLKALLRLRELKDPLKHIEYTPAQKLARASRAMFRLVSGPNRSGKTLFGCTEVVEAALRRHPTRSSEINGIYGVFCISREQLRDVWGQKLLKCSRIQGPCFDEPMIPPHEILRIRHDPTSVDIPREIYLKNGNRIIFGLSGVKKSWEFLQGKDFVLGVCVDEGAGVQELIDEIAARMLDGIGNAEIERRTGGSWMLWTTTETLINEAHAKFKEKCQSEDPQFKDFEYHFLPPSENKAISDEARQRIGAAMSEEARKIRMEGTEGAMGATLIYPQFSDARHILAEDYVPTSSDNLWFGYDPGVDHPTGMFIGAVSENAPTQVKVVKCWRHRRMTLDHDLDLLEEWLRGRFLEAVIYDPASKKRDKVFGQSVIGQMTERMRERGIRIARGFPQSGYNRVQPGIMMVRQYLDPPPAWSPSGTPLLVLNPSQESGCQMMRGEFLMYRGYPERDFTGAGGVIKKHDDLMDPLRYICMQRPHWVKRDDNPPLWEPGWEPQRPEVDARVQTAEDLILAERMAKSARAAQKRSGRRIPHGSRY